MDYRDWQRKHGDQMVASLEEHGVFADTSYMGSGKTVMACLAAKRLGVPAFVVCPKVCGPQWRSTARACGIDLDGVTPQKACWFKKDKDGVRFPVPEHRYGHWKRRGVIWEWSLPKDTLLIFDEAHMLSGSSSQTAKLGKAAKAQGYKTLLLSATLAESPLKLKAPGYMLGLHNYHDWQLWMSRNGVGKAHFGGFEFFGGEGAMQAIREQLGIRIGGITKDEIPGYSDNWIGAIDVPADKTLDKEYDAYLAELQDDAETRLVEELRIRQRSELAKCTSVAELCKNAVQEGCSPIVFCNFRESAARLARALKCEALNSNSTTEDLAKICRDLDEGTPAVVIAQAGGVGLDGLQDRTGKHPRVAYHMPGYDAQVTVQATGRAAREDSKTPTKQYFVYAAGSEVESRMRKSIESKIDNLAALTNEDLSIR